MNISPTGLKRLLMLALPVTLIAGGLLGFLLGHSPEEKESEKNSTQGNAEPAAPENTSAPVANPTPPVEVPAPEPAVEEIPPTEPTVPATEEPEETVAPEPEPEPAPAPQPEAPAEEPAPEPAPEQVVDEGPIPDIPEPVADASPSKFPEQYKQFVEKLKEQTKENSDDYCAAATIVVDATNDELALDEWMEKAAEQGNPAAMVYLGKKGISAVHPSKFLSAPTKKAYQWLRKAAAKKYDPAYIYQSFCLTHGIGVEKSRKDADAALLNSCKSGCFESRFKWLQLSGRLEKFEDKDRKEVATEIERGNHHVIYYLSARTNNMATRLEWLKKAAAAGNANATYALANMVAGKDPKLSFQLLRKAIEMRNADAMFVYGTSLIAPKSMSRDFTSAAGIQRNVPEGIRYLRIAAALGNTQAQLALANSSYDGLHGIKKDINRAYKLYSNAGHKATPAAAIGIAAKGYMTLVGEGCKANPEEGLALLKTAANLQYPYACVLLAYAQYEGIGMEADAQLAIQFLQDAVSLGMPEAYIYIAWIYARGGAGLEPNEAEAEQNVLRATLDMKDRARTFYDDLIKKDKWPLHP